jgi:hypothetical protein
MNTLGCGWNVGLPALPWYPDIRHEQDGRVVSSICQNTMTFLAFKGIKNRSWCSFCGYHKTQRAERPSQNGIKLPYTIPLCDGMSNFPGFHGNIPAMFCMKNGFRMKHQLSTKHVKQHSTIEWPCTDEINAWFAIRINKQLTEVVTMSD